MNVKRELYSRPVRYVCKAKTQRRTGTWHVFYKQVLVIDTGEWIKHGWLLVVACKENDYCHNDRPEQR